MNIYEHRVLHSANKITRNIWYFGNDIELRRTFGRHFLVALEGNAAQILISTDSTSHEMHDIQPEFACLRSKILSRAYPF